MTRTLVDPVFDMAAARRSLAEKRRHAEADNAAALERARADFNAILKMIVNDYDPVAVYQWGSLIEGNFIAGFSDIDMAVEGVSEPKRFSEMFGKAENLTPLPLDIVRLECVEPEFRRIILLKGKKVYERPA